MLRPNAMKLIAPFDSVVIDLDTNDQQILRYLIELQENAGDVSKRIEGKHESTKICNIQWKRLKYIVMAGTRDSKQITIPLDEHEQILLQRYIDAEKRQPDFISKGLSKNFLHEVFLYIYYAGHGCADSSQYIILNETNIDKIFWPAEDKIKLILRRSGSNLKSLVVFDCCREDYTEARNRVIEALKSVNFLQEIESLGKEGVK